MQAFQQVFPLPTELILYIWKLKLNTERAEVLNAFLKNSKWFTLDQTALKTIFLKGPTCYKMKAFLNGELLSEIVAYYPQDFTVSRVISFKLYYESITGIESTLLGFPEPDMLGTLFFIDAI
jgi:hypothetical protein